MKHWTADDIQHLLEERHEAAFSNIPHPPTSDDEDNHHKSKGSGK